MKIIRRCKICGRIIWPWQEKYENKDYHEKCVKEQLQHFELNLERPSSCPKRKLYSGGSLADFIAAQIVSIIWGIIAYLSLPEKSLPNIGLAIITAFIIWYILNAALYLDEVLP